MNVGDFIIKQDGGNEGTIWKIIGIYYGGLGHQDLVGLIPFNRKEGGAHGLTVTEMLVPIELAEGYLFKGATQ
jgi:hypothetical protein